MTPIDNTDALQKVCATGVGYIYNDFDGMTGGTGMDNVLHKATCTTLANATVPPRKYFSPDPAPMGAVTWLEANRGPENIRWKKCEANNPYCF